MAFGISGFLVQLLTAPIAIAIDAVSYVVSALLLGTIRQPEAPPPPRADREPVLAEIREGLRLVRHDPVLRAFAGAQMALAALWGVFGATWFLFVLDELRLEPGGRSASSPAVGGVSSFIGAVVADPRDAALGHRAGRDRRRCSWRRSATRSSRSRRPALPLIAIGCLVMQQLVADSAVTVYDITEVSVRQTLVHDRALGRVTSTFHVAAMLAQLAATLAAGLLAEAIGAAGDGLAGAARRAGRRGDPVVLAGPAPRSCCRRRSAERAAGRRARDRRRRAETRPAARRVSAPVRRTAPPRRRRGRTG